MSSSTTRPDDAELTIEALYAEHARPVRSYASRLLSDHHAAEDVLQETMIRAWKNRERLENGMPTRGWLLTVAHNVAVDRLRSAAKRHETSVDPQDGPDLGSVLEDDHASTVVRSMEVESLLERIPPLHREVVYLTFMKDLSIDQAADVLNVPSGTVKSRRHYALSMLRKLAA